MVVGWWMHHCHQNLVRAAWAPRAGPTARAARKAESRFFFRPSLFCGVHTRHSTTFSSYISYVARCS